MLVVPLGTSTLHTLLHFIFPMVLCGRYSDAPILQMETLRLREMTYISPNTSELEVQIGSMVERLSLESERPGFEFQCKYMTLHQLFQPSKPHVLLCTTLTITMPTFASTWQCPESPSHGAWHSINVRHSQHLHREATRRGVPQTKSVVISGC